MRKIQSNAWAEPRGGEPGGSIKRSRCAGASGIVCATVAGDTVAAPVWEERG